MKHLILTFLTFLIAVTTSQLLSAEEGWRSLITGSSASGYVIEGASNINVKTAKLMHDDGAAFVDLRSRALWSKGHIPNAVRCSNFTEKNFISITPKNQNIVFYCDGFGCELSANASAMAVKWGFQNVFHFSEGLVGWRNAGLAIEK